MISSLMSGLAMRWIWTRSPLSVPPVVLRTVVVARAVVAQAPITGDPLTVTMEAGTSMAMVFTLKPDTESAAEFCESLAVFERGQDAGDSRSECACVEVQRVEVRRPDR